MHLTMMLVVGSAMLGNAPTWLTDYADAQAQSARVNRPLAVFISHEGGPAHCCQEGKLSEGASELLARHYLCVFLDARAPENKSLVEAFALSSGKGVILSDRGGRRQAFYHDGALSMPDLVKALRTVAAVDSAPATPVVFTAANFDAEVLKSKQPVLVDFFADWCAPCRRMAPVVAELGADFRGIARVGKLNTDHARDIASRYNVSAIPAFLIFQEGRVVDRVVGVTSKEDLAARLRNMTK